MSDQQDDNGLPTVEDMLCTLYTTLQGVGKRVDAQTELIKQQTAMLNLLFTDLTNLRVQMAGRLPGPQVPAPSPTPAITQQGKFPWDQRKDEATPEDVFKGMGQGIPNR